MAGSNAASHTTAPLPRPPRPALTCCCWCSMRLVLYNKGAAEWVLKRCTAMTDEYGQEVQLSEAKCEELLQVWHITI